MQIGFVGLGKMGGNMVHRIQRDSEHECVAFDRKAASVEAAESHGATGVGSLEDLVGKLEAPRTVWVMVPAGEATESTVLELADLLDPGDLIVDGGNSNFHDDIRRGAELAERAFAAEGNDLEAIVGHVSDSGEGRWTVFDGIDRDVPTPVITAALYARFYSRGAGDYTNRMLAALRNQFGGHDVERAAGGG